MKYKLAATAFAAAVIVISIYAAMRPSYDLGLFVDLGRVYARARILLALGVASYVLIPGLRLKLTQIIMLAGGGLLLALGIISIFSPMLFGYLSHYTALGDVLMAVEGGTLSMLAGLELKTRKLHLRKPFIFMPAYFQGKLFSFKPSTTSSQSRTA